MIYIYGLSSSIEPENIRYIGKTKNLKDRLRRHLSDLKIDTYKNRWIKSELKKGNNILITELYKVSENDDWCEIEKRFIKKYKKKGFNLTNGTLGGDGFDLEKNVIEKRNNTRIKNNLKNKQFDITKFKIKKLKNGFEGERTCPCCEKIITYKNHNLNSLVYLLRKSIERKCKNCKSLGRYLSQETKNKISKSKENLSLETRKKFSKIHKGKKLSEKTKEKLRIANLGKKHSYETRKKMSESAKRRKKSI